MDVRKKLVELLKEIVAIQECGFGDPRPTYETVASYLMSHGVTVQELDGCDYCKEDNEGYRKMLGAFSIANPFHGNVWNIETSNCKPRQIYFCPMCGRRLPQPPKGE